MQIEAIVICLKVESREVICWNEGTKTLIITLGIYAQ